MTDQLQAALEACRVPCPVCCSTYRNDPCQRCGGNGNTIGRILPPAVLAALRAVAEACERIVLTGRAECCCESIGPKCEWCLRGEIVADIAEAVRNHLLEQLK